MKPSERSEHDTAILVALTLIALVCSGCSDDVSTTWSFDETATPEIEEPLDNETPPEDPDDLDDEPGLLDPPEDPPEGPPPPDSDEELWEPYEPCETGRVPLNVPPPTDQPWAAPEFDEFRDSAERTTEDIFTTPYQGNGSGGARYFDGSIGHNWDGLVQHVFVNPGDPVIIRSAWASGEDTQTWVEDRTAHSLMATVDHEVVPIDVEVWDAERDEQLHDVSGTSFSYPVPENRADVWDVTIPAEHFTPGRTHDVALFDSWVSDDDAGHEGFSMRWAVHYGGFETPETRPCAERPLDQPATEWEVWANRSRYDALLFPVGRQDKVIVHDPTLVDAEPGSMQTVRLSFFRPRFEVRDIGETIGVYYVTLNGEPVLGPVWQRFGPRPANVDPIVDARQRLEFRLPEEPGVYDLAVQVTFDPWMTSWDMFGYEKDRNTRNRNTTLSLGSAIRYEVGIDSDESPQN